MSQQIRILPRAFGELSRCKHVETPIVAYLHEITYQEAVENFQHWTAVCTQRPPVRKPVIYSIQQLINVWKTKQMVMTLVADLSLCATCAITTFVTTFEPFQILSFRCIIHSKTVTAVLITNRQNSIFSIKSILSVNFVNSLTRSFLCFKACGENSRTSGGIYT